MIENILLGLRTVLTPENLTYCFFGVLIGTMVGVLPGVGPVAGTALLLPVTYLVPPSGSIILLAGIFYGAMYGGSTTSILLNLPGEAASAVTCLDGYAMARKGRAGLPWDVGFWFLHRRNHRGNRVDDHRPTAGPLGLRFGPPEQFALRVLGLTLLAYIGSKSMTKALIMMFSDYS